jgi:hypothetical protein
MPKSIQVWRSDNDNKMYHDACFEDGEPRDGYSPVKRDDLDLEDECDSCGGIFLMGFLPEGQEDEDDEDEC